MKAIYQRDHLHVACNTLLVDQLCRYFFQRDFTGTHWNYTVSQKNVTTFRYKSDIRESILKIFGTNVIEKLGNQTVLYFTTSPS